MGAGSPPRRRLRVGFDNDLGIIDARIVEISVTKKEITSHPDDEKIIWSDEVETETTVWRFRVQTVVVLAALTWLTTTAFSVARALLA